MFVFILRGDKR